MILVKTLVSSLIALFILTLNSGDVPPEVDLTVSYPITEVNDTQTRIATAMILPTSIFLFIL